MPLSHDHKLVVAAVALCPGRVRGSIAAGTRARDEVEALLLPEFFHGAPFDFVSVVLRCGERTQLQPRYQRIGTYQGMRELPITLELEMNRLRRIKEEEVYAIYRQALLDALIAVAAKYGLQAERLQQARAQTPTVIENSPRSAPD